jgi:hypothetical protein
MISASEIARPDIARGDQRSMNIESVACAARRAWLPLTMACKPCRGENERLM